MKKLLVIIFICATTNLLAQSGETDSVYIANGKVVRNVPARTDSLGQALFLLHYNQLVEHFQKVNKQYLIDSTKRRFLAEKFLKYKAIKDSLNW